MHPGDLGALGHYRAISVLGEGGMGIVLKCHDTRTSRLVAIKIIKPGMTDELARIRFVREARTVARISHPNVVAIFGVESPEDLPPFFIMEFVNGPSLKQRLRREPPLSVREAVRICVSVAQGLAAVHAHGLVHRDIKPGNILIDEISDLPKIADFGLARSSELSGWGSVTPGGFVGTPAYMSPEQILHPSRVDERSDIYSLGLTLYEALTGLLPFGSDRGDLVARILNEDPRPLRSLNPRIPRDLEIIVLKTLSKDPSGRYATAVEFGDDLRRFLEGRAIHARPISYTERLVRWVRRNPAIAATSASLVLALSTGLVITTYFAAQATRSRIGLDHEKSAREAAELQARISRVQLLAAEAQATIDDHPQRAAAGRRERPVCPAWKLPRVAASEQALHDALGSAGGHDLVADLRRAVAHDGPNENEKDIRIQTSPDGRYLVVSLTSQPTRLWDLDRPDADPVVLNGQAEGFRIDGFSPDGRRLAEVKNGSIRIWNLSDQGAPPRVLEAPSGEVDLSFSPDGDWVAATSPRAAASRDRYESARVIRIWNLRNDGFAPIDIPIAPDGLVRTALSPQGQRLAVASATAVQVWDLNHVAALPTRLEYQGNEPWVEFSASGRWLIGCEASAIRLWDLEHPYREPLDRPMIPASDEGLQSAEGMHNLRFELAPNRLRLLVIGPDGTGRLWNVESPEAPPITLSGHAGICRGVAFDRDGTRLALTDEVGVDRLWTLTRRQ